MGAVQQIAPARDQRDALGGVIDHHRQVIAGAHAAPGQHDIADLRQETRGRQRHVLRQTLIVKAQRAEAQVLNRAGCVQTDRVAFARVIHAAMAAGAGIDRTVRTDARRPFLRGRQGRTDIGAVAAAGIDQAQFRQPVQRCAIGGQAIRLPQDGLRPSQAQPMQILGDQRLVFRAAAGSVDILDPQQEPARIRQPGGGQGREGVAQMQRAGGRGRKARYCAASHARKSALARSV